MCKRQWNLSSFLWMAMLVAALPAWSPALSGADHPTFNGAWKLDRTASDFGALPGPTDLMDTIDHQPAALVINRVRDGQAAEIRIPLDGSEADNNIVGAKLKTKAHWEGAVLVVNQSGTRMGSPVTFVERWTLSADGKSLKVARHLTSARGETDQTLVLLKQNPGNR